MDIVYYGRYLRFMESAESAFFAERGWTYDRLRDEGGVWLARVRLTVEYRAPARLDDEVQCRAELHELRGSSLRLTFPIDRTGGTRLADGELVLAALARETLRPARLPAAFAAALRA